MNAGAARAQNPLFNGNKMKLGIIAMNCSHGSTITAAEGAWEMTWPETKETAIMADRAGMEVLLPVARWKGYGGPTNFNNRTFETYTWAAALGAVTDYSCIFSTSHVALVHPVMAAKQATTIDHVTNGRFGLNIVAGWFKNEFDMFGAAWMEHDQRYSYAAEWLDVARKLWTTDGYFDHAGTHFSGTNLWHEPKPIQRPFPPIMNAGASPAGQNFAATQCDMTFSLLGSHDLAEGKAQIETVKSLGRAQGKELQVWIHVYAVCRETEAEAKRFLHHYVVEKGDYEAVDNLLEIFGIQSQTLDPSVLDEMKFHFIAGHGGYPLVGTPEQIVDEMQKLIDIGVDGCLISWVDYTTEVKQWIDEVMPLMEQAGQRAPKPV